MDGKANGFSYAELAMIVDGIISMMENTNKAMALTKNPEIHKLMVCDLEKLCALNDKVSRMMGESEERGRRGSEHEI